MPTLLQAIGYCDTLDLELDEKLKKQQPKRKKGRNWDFQPLQSRAVTCSGRLPPLQRTKVTSTEECKKRIDDRNKVEMHRRKLPPLLQRRKSSGWDIAKGRARILAVMKSTETKKVQKSGLPFTKKDFDRLKCCFEALDIDRNGVLDFGELQEVGDFCGFKVDQETFEKMDTDNSGTIEFSEMLRIIYPNCPVRNITLAIAKWDKDAPQLVWSDQFEQEDAAEIEQVFRFFSDSEPALTINHLRSKLSPIIGTEYIESLFSEFGANNQMSVAQFSEMMSFCYAK
eukprot:TRINITY_DN16984_c0_g1_i1.p1 TRINITY_DN16984_c0_g1~~TRINITY_DN16984_c0_g1_i1.p1  ORF type:complete len:284 (+),score=62.65 TRINITY_DN16984_c0_g1_i1:79-930(+)